ncbi:hypothetical protein [Aequorivita xiaoshiensis]|uniref:Lipoprotein n=1 Tax=Aequorivita xiaoshiensis TaxID=2874476 RepID=A0A9X1U5T2_9FLAO|nr:hypothetical protein [Aequorivita xiaoshiensis]MCG2430512.1 hypothetical protein [Aequorivita xiaoshiensis]
MKNTILLIFSLIILSSCTKKEGDCSVIDIIEPVINISILDSLGNSLIGENNIYKPSEITLTRGSQTVFLSFEENNNITYIRLLYTDMESEKNYELKLNGLETDILNIKYRLERGECFDYLVIEGFYVNGEEMVFDNDSYSYIIRK